jgi:hypothetical protein
MNFAWANPTTGLREQTPHAYVPYFAAELGPLRQEARRRAWQSLQDDPQTPSDEVQIYEQIRAGSVTQESDSNIDLSEVMRAEWNQEDCQFAFSHPVNGLRIVAAEWPGYLKEVLAADPVGFISEVAIYASRPAFTVKRTDPAPNAAEPVPGREHPELDDLEAIHQEVADFIDLDGGNPAPKATALALIDIARSLRRLLGEFTPPPPSPVDDDQASRHPYGSASHEFSASILAANPLWSDMVCTCIGDGLTADGAYCVCPAGMQRKRAAAVASRPIPVQESPIYREVTTDGLNPANPASPLNPLNPENPANPFDPMPFDR